MVIGIQMMVGLIVGRSVVMVISRFYRSVVGRLMIVKVVVLSVFWMSVMMFDFLIVVCMIVMNLFVR